MSIPPIEPGDGDDHPGGGSGGGGGGSNPPPNQLPGLAGLLVPRWTFNCLISDRLTLWEFFSKVVMPSSRMYKTQGPNGKIRLHNKKPAEWARASGALTGDTITLDDVSNWIAKPSGLVLIDPYTTSSEVRTVTAAEYPVSQNSITLTTNEPTDIDITGFSGCDGADTPATATIEILTADDATSYEITLDGVLLPFEPSAADTPDTVASFIAGYYGSHPVIQRKYLFAVDGAIVTITARFGDITLSADLIEEHTAAVADPVDAPVLTEVAGDLAAGTYKVMYAFANHRGLTNLSPYTSITIVDDKNIEVDAITPPAGCTVVWFISVGPVKLREHSVNDGSSFEISTLPDLDDAGGPDINRTGAEVMRISARFSDREEDRSEIDRANVLKGAFEWQLGARDKATNLVELTFRDSTDDWREVKMKVKNKAHIEKTHKESKYEINGNGINTFFQAFRVASGELTVRRDSDFFYRWSSSRGAVLIEPGDVVAITDRSTGVINFPVWIEEKSSDIGSKPGMPRVSFTARKYTTEMFNDSPYKSRQLLVRG